MKKINMKTLSLISSLSSLVLLMACGDDVTNNEVLKAESYTTKEDLPECNEKLDGKFATIPSKGEVYICSDKAWKSLLNKVVSDDGKFACSTAELANGTGYKVVCGGDSVAVVLNGSKGATGEEGSKGADGSNGTNGNPGEKGSDGKDYTLADNGCAILYYSSNYTLYDCGDSAYVKPMQSAPIITWNALSLSQEVFDINGDLFAQWSTRYIESGTAGKSTGKLVRWEGDGSWTNPMYVGSTDELVKNLAIAGTDTVKVQSGATVGDYGLEPLVGAFMEFENESDISSWGGLCLTYNAEKDMEVVVYDGSDEYIARSTLKASAKQTTANIRWTDFKTDLPYIHLEENIDDVALIIIKASGSLDTGTYTNTFAIYEFGAYGNCNGPTGNDLRAWASKISAESDTLVDDRDPLNPVKYATVTIGNQTWMAQNLRAPYDAKTVGTDGVAGTSDDNNMSLCPSDPDELVAKGCLYSWAAAMDSVGLYNPASFYQDSEGNDVALRHCGFKKDCPLTAPVKGICPDGWHLPSLEELDTLLANATFDKNYPNLTFNALSSEYENWLGFSAANVGVTTNDVGAMDASASYFMIWSTYDDSDSDYAGKFSLKYSDKSVSVLTDYPYFKNRGLSVRCIKDQVQD